VTAPQPECRLAPIFLRQTCHLGIPDVGGIGDDDIVPPALQPLIDVRFERVHAFFKPMSRHVESRHRERLLGNVRRVDSGVRKGERTRDRDTTGPGTDVEETTNAARVEPGFETGRDQLGDRRSRDQNPLVDVKFVPREPHAPREIGGRHALANAPLEKREDGTPFLLCQHVCVRCRRILVAKPRAEERQLRSVVDRIVGAVAEPQPRALEHPGPVRDHGLGSGGIRETFPFREGLGAERACGVRYCRAGKLSMPANRSIAIVIAVIVAVTAGMLLSRELLDRTTSKAGPVLVQGTLIEPARPLPTFSLVDHTAAPFGPDRLRNRWTYIFFGFTHCPDICPVTLAVLAQTEKILADLPLASRPQILFVSVDPQRDTPKRLAEYVQSFGSSIVGATGEKQQIDALTQHMAAPAAMRDGGEGNYGVDHSGSVFLVDPNGAWRALFSMPHTPAGLADDYRRLIAR
jgi:protein SCO1/2